MTRSRSPFCALPVALGLVLAAAVPPAAAQEKAAPVSLAGTYQIDPAHSSVLFRIRHLFTKVPGRFTAVSGTIQFDPGKPAATQVAVDIDATSITTDNAKRDGHLKSPDFFDVEKYPALAFKSTAVKMVDATHATMTGDLTMHGVTKPVTLAVELLGQAPGPRGDVRVGFAADGKLNRMDYGVAWNRALEGGGSLLGDEVEISISVEAVKAPPEAPAK
jgi:polyisoprenoid-binding protein YceI